MFGIKLKDRVKELKNRVAILEFDLAAEKCYRENLKKEMEYQNKILIDGTKALENTRYSKSELIEKLNEYTGVTKLEIAANTEVKFEFDKPRVFLIIE